MPVATKIAQCQFTENKEVQYIQNGEQETENDGCRVQQLPSSRI